MTNEKRNKLLRIISVMLLPLIFAAVGFYMAFSYDYSYREERAETVHVTSARDLQKIGKSFYNNNYFLENDIVLDSFKTLTKAERPFEGVFDGKGHTITFKGSVNSAFIGYIGESGAVRNLNIVFDNCSVETDFVGLIAYENSGEIADCKVSGNVTLQQSGVVSLLVALNKGTIRNVVLENVTVTRATVNGATVYGGVCAYNYGNAENIVAFTTKFVNISETNRESMFYDGARNYGVGSVCGINMGVLTGLKEVDETQYLTDDEVELLVHSSSIIETLTLDYAVHELGFNVTSVWSYKNGSLTLREIV